MRTYKLYAALANNSDLCNVTVQRSGRIKGIRWSLSFNGTADNDTAVVELSTQPTSHIGTHDSIGDIDLIQIFNNTGANGVGLAELNTQRDVDFPVAAGERLYLNCLLTNATGSVTCYVDIAD